MSKLDELGGIDYIKNGRPQLLHGDGGSRWAGQAIDALIERIEELEAELKPLRELREMVLFRDGEFNLPLVSYWEAIKDKARECKKLDGGPVRANGDRLVDAIDAVFAHYDSPHLEAVKRDLLAAVEAL